MKSHSAKLLVGLLAISLMLLVAHVWLKYISVVVYQEQHLAFFELSNRLDMNDENSVPQWFTLIGFLIISTSSFAASYLSRDRGKRWLWGIIALIALLLSVDDAAAIHESVLQLIHLTFFTEGSASFTQNAWLVLLPFVAAGLIGLLIAAVQLLPGRTVAALALGSGIYLTGAIFVDSLVNTVAARSFADQGVLAGVEGWLQLVGLSVLVYAICDYLERQHGKDIAAALKRLKAS